MITNDVRTPPTQPPEQPRNRWYRRHPIWTGIILAFATFAVIGTIAGPDTTTGTTAKPPAATAPAVPPAGADVATTAPPAPPVANPQGNWQGGGADYLLPSDAYGPVWLVGEINVTNTGNIGIIVKARMGWQQEGQADYTATKTVRVPVGATRTVRFHVNAGSEAGAGGPVIDSIQSWQLAHGDQQLGTYHVRITGTYGQPQAS